MSEGQLNWAERMERFLRGVDPDETQHPKFTWAGRRFTWQPPSGRSDLHPHRGMAAHWKSGPPGTLVVCLDCVIRTHARRGVNSEDLLRRDIRTWRLRHDRVVKAETSALVQAKEETDLLEKRLADLASVVETQATHGNWDYNDYMCGLYNGLELAWAILKGETPKFRKKPDAGWLQDKPLEVRLAQAERTPSPGDPVLEAYVYEAAAAGEVKE